MVQIFWSKDRPVDLVGIINCCGGGICGIGPSLSMGGSRCNVGFTMRKDLLASLTKVIGLDVDVSIFVTQSQSSGSPNLVLHASRDRCSF